MTDQALRLVGGERDFGPWRRASIRELLAAVGYRGAIDLSPVGTRPFILAVDGRSAGGKSTLAAQIIALTPDAALLHADDLAWHEPYFEWGHLLAEVLHQARSGAAIELRPPAWERMGRAGTVAFPAGLSLLVIEGVGASQAEASHLIDAAIWVQSDFGEAERRGIERDVEQGVNGDRAASVAFWHEWMGHELAFLERDRPWDRAAAVVLGTPGEAVPAGVVVVGDFDPNGSGRER